MNKQEQIRTGGFTSAGEFYSRVRSACFGIGGVDSRLVRVGQKTAGHMAEGDDAQGGFLVPEQYADGIYEAAALEGQVVRPRTNKIFKMVSDTLDITTLIDTDRSSNIYGGITFTWTAEAAQKSGSLISKPAIGELGLTAHKLVAGCFASNELENDHGQFATFMNLSFGKALSFIEDDYFIRGSGVGQPRGVLGSGAEITVTRATDNRIDWTDFAHLAKRLLPASWANVVWLVNPDALDELLEATASAANQVVMLNANERRFWGAPIIASEHCSAIDATGDLMLYDFNHYAIGDRSLEISASRQADFASAGGFSFDSTFWRVVLRVAGQPTLGAPITPLRGSNTLSPFVVLSTDS